MLASLILLPLEQKHQHPYFQGLVLPKPPSHFLDNTMAMLLTEHGCPV